MERTYCFRSGVGKTPHIMNTFTKHTTNSHHLFNDPGVVPPPYVLVSPPPSDSLPPLTPAGSFLESTNTPPLLGKPELSGIYIYIYIYIINNIRIYTYI